MITAKDVADYFLSMSDEEAGDLLSNLKLQKLAYYAQGFHLALFDKPLFPESIQAWTHGPVVPDLYHRFKEYGSGAIPVQTFDPSSMDDCVRSLLDEVYSVYGQYSAWKLRNLTHDEPTWVDAYRNAPSSEITHDSMKAFFKTLLN